jgi:hypothetical protein
MVAYVGIAFSVYGTILSRSKWYKNNCTRKINYKSICYWFLGKEELFVEEKSRSGVHFKD